MVQANRPHTQVRNVTRRSPKADAQKNDASPTAAQLNAMDPSCAPANAAIYRTSGERRRVEPQTERKDPGVPAQPGKG